MAPAIVYASFFQESGLNMGWKGLNLLKMLQNSSSKKCNGYLQLLTGKNKIKRF